MYLYVRQYFGHAAGFCEAVTPGHLIGGDLQFLIGHIMIELVNFDLISLHTVVECNN